MSTHAKVIWMGEHTVLYQQIGLALPLFDATVEVKVSRSTNHVLKSPFYHGLIEDMSRSYQSIRQLITRLVEVLDLPPVQLDLSLNIPIGAGLGASAAIACECTRALYQFAHQPFSDETLREWVSFSEEIAHGKQSGIDVFGVTTDKAFTFQKGKQPQSISLAMEGYLLVVDSKMVGQTKQAVKLVETLYQFSPNDTLPIIEHMAATMNDFLIALNARDYTRIGQCMTSTHIDLQQLQVSHPTLDQMVNLALSNDALGAKLTGGGLGGCMICLVKDYFQLCHLQSTFEDHGFKNQFVIDLRRL